MPVKLKGWRPGEPLFAVVNSLGFVTADVCESGMHVALWPDRDDAQRHAIALQRGSASEYRIVPVEIVEAE